MLQTNLPACTNRQIIFLCVLFLIFADIRHKDSLWGNLRERDHSGDPGIDGRIILRWILMKWDVGYGLY
jgi:hypothetical protein